MLGLRTGHVIGDVGRVDRRVSLHGVGALVLCLLLPLTGGCPDLPELFAVVTQSSTGDADPGDARHGDRQTTADRGAGGEAGADAGGCGPSTPSYGEPCGDCGFFVCDLSDQLICYDPGVNDCGVCGDLDQTAGALGSDCGICGVIACAGDGLATECRGEHAPNVCGGCETIPSIDDGTGRPRQKGPPGATCSSCQTGSWVCTADRNDLACYRGRGTTSCGGCSRCVLFHAEMDQRLGGGFIRTGTIALIEDTGTDPDVGSDTTAGTNRSLVFDPLIAGPAASGLAQSYVIISPTADPGDFSALLLFPEFASSAILLPADDVRRFPIYDWVDLRDYAFVIVYDYFFEAVVSSGHLVAGPPTTTAIDGGMHDAGGIDRDGSIGDVRSIDGDSDGGPDAVGDLTSEIVPDAPPDTTAPDSRGQDG